MWRELNLGISPEVEKTLFAEPGRSGRAFRKKLAALNTKYNIGLPSWAFGYGDDGKPLTDSDLSLAMSYTPGGLRLTAIGATSCQMLEDRSGAILAALMTEAQALIPMHLSDGEHKAEFLPFEKPYFINRLTLGKFTRDSFWFTAMKAVENGSSWLKEADRKLPLAISRGLMRQSVGILNEGDDLEGNIEPFLTPAISGTRPWLDTGREFGQRLGVKVKSVGAHTMARHGDVAMRLVLKNVELTMRCDITGAWFVGRQKIEGSGLIRPATGAWTQQKEAAA